MRAILGWWRITRMVRPLTETTMLRAILTVMLWLCVALESQSSRGLLHAAKIFDRVWSLTHGLDPPAQVRPL